KVAEEFPHRQLILLGFDRLILNLSPIGTGADTAARKDLLSGTKIHGVADAPDVAANAARVAPEDGGAGDARQPRFAPEERIENLGNVVAGGYQKRKDCAGGRSHQKADLARLWIGARAESGCESESA